MESGLSEKVLSSTIASYLSPVQAQFWPVFLLCLVTWVSDGKEYLSAANVCCIMLTLFPIAA
jgi:hypothetical protein